LASKPLLKARLEFGELKVDLEGTVDEVFRGVVKFVETVYPSLELLSKVTFTVDTAKLMEGLAGVVQIGPEGPILVAERELPADEAIELCLLGQLVGYKLGRLDKDSLPVEDLSRVVGKARKTVANQLAGIVREGIVERVTKGEYRITTQGIRHVSEALARTKSKAEGGKS